mmetsp:Transcript_4513/g.13692  ORF Transcript_4513/g.13692 Transcript_4513/m.13692 type:complete len:172 (+) Transcript_4513:185-700(+)
MDIRNLLTAGAAAQKSKTEERSVLSGSEMSSQRAGELEGMEAMSPVTQASPASSLRTEEFSLSAPMKCSLERKEDGNSALAKKPFFCTRCLTGFSTKGNLNVHLRTVHYKTYDFRCNHCERQFSTKASLLRHVRMVHFGERPFTCPHCTSMFATKACVKRHSERRHRNAAV